MADKCKKEKKSLDEAKRARDRAERQRDKKDLEYYHRRAQAETEIASIDECSEPVVTDTTAEGGFRISTEPTEDEVVKCIVDKLGAAEELMEQALEADEAADEYSSEWGVWETEVGEREEKYCDCVNRQSHH